MKIQVNVTTDDIAAGKRDNPTKCPIACVIKRATDNGVVVNVHKKYVFLANFSTVAVSCLPRSAVAFISAFDEGQQVEPFTFELEVPGSVVKDRT